MPTEYSGLVVTQPAETAFDTPSGGLLLLDREWRITSMTSGFAHYCAHLDEAALGRNVWEAWPDLVGTDIAAHWQRAMTERHGIGFVARDSVSGRRYAMRVEPTVDGGLTVHCQRLTQQAQQEVLHLDLTRVLQLMARGAPLRDVLDTLVGTIEHQSVSGLIGSVLLLDDSGRHLLLGAAPSLPADYNAAIDGLEIGPTVGSCGTAAYLNRPIYVSDIANDPLWANFRDLALLHGLGACWSTPIVASGGDVLGTFAMYYPEAREPPAEDLELVEMVTRTAAIAIERHRTERALRDSEQHFRLLFEQAVDGIFVADSHGRYVDVNAAGCSMLGYSQQELRELTIVDVIAADEIARLDGEIARLDGGAVASSSWRFRRKDGSTFIGELVARQLPGGRMQAIVRDVTERAAVEAALRASEERFRDLADNIPQLAWIADPGSDGQVSWFNRNWFDFTGTTHEQACGSGWRQVLHPDHAPRVIEKFSQHVRECIDWEDTFLLRRHDGEYRWFLSRMRVIRDDSGAVVRIFGTNTDITQQREMENELRRLADELSQTDRRKNEFLAMLAHELRNPLAPIRNAAQMLRHVDGRRDAVVSASAMIERQIGQLVRLVDDLLDVSRIDRGRIELRRQAINLASVVEQAVESARDLFAAKEQRFSVEMPEQRLSLDADPARIAQVIGNLLHNASKFTPVGGAVRLAVDQHGSEAWVRIIDDGIGLHGDHLDCIFDLFVQVDTSLERSSSGLGIGLTLVRQLVEMHGGAVEVHSDGPGKGCEFVVRLPLQAAAQQATEPASDEPPKAADARCILIVDDNRDSAESLAMLLEFEGHQTHMAFDGPSGLQAAIELQPDLLLLDIGLPGINGFELAQQIRAQPGWGSRAILLALTGWGQDEDRQASRDAGFDGHLVKPVDFTALSSLIASMLDQPPERQHSTGMPQR
ncbi:PAS domain S-box protein [Piscinibacter sakaiensis]|uniref:PAS domain S-box protein n=1 Tax=Piscinibacter sakaiensis TaxID=1547922 RepID=UPI003AAACBA1